MDFGLIELFFVFGVVLLFGFWELYKLRKLKRDRREKREK